MATQALEILHMQRICAYRLFTHLSYVPLIFPFTSCLIICLYQHDAPDPRESSPQLYAWNESTLYA